NLAGDLAVGVGDRLVELVLVDLDRELDLVPLEGRDGGLHRGERGTARGGTPYYLRGGRVGFKGARGERRGVDPRTTWGGAPATASDAARRAPTGTLSARRRGV